MRHMTDEEELLPLHSLPLFAPLSRPVASRLLEQEAQPYKRLKKSSRPLAETLRTRVLSRVAKERETVYEYMDDFIAAARIEGKPFPSNEWILEVLASRTPKNIINSEESLRGWRLKGVLKRSSLPRRNHPAPFTLTSVAGLLLARYASLSLQRDWLPEKIPVDEPEWWCFAKRAPGLDPVPIPVPSPQMPASTLLWTPWRGVLWEERGWIPSQDGALRWASPFSSVREVAVWNSELAREIEESARGSRLLARIAVQETLLEEAARLILETQAQRSFLREHWMSSHKKEEDYDRRAKGDLCLRST